MRGFIKICLWIVVGLLLACAPKPVKPPPLPAPVDTGSRLFETAEELYLKKSYDKALEAFSAYFHSYPDQPLAPAALLKIAQIHAIQGETGVARETFARLSAQYPDSPLVPEAKLGMVAADFQEGKYREAVLRGTALAEEPLTPEQSTRLFSLLGDSAESMGADADAYVFFDRAAATAADPEREGFSRRLKEIGRRLQPASIPSLLDRLGDTAARGLLLYELGLYRTEQEQYQAAIDVFTELVETLPDHEDADRAAERIDELKKKLLQQIEKKPPFRRDSIGCLLPLSGPFEPYGTRALNGIELALNEFGADGKQPAVTVLVKDTGSDADQALRGVRELAEANVAAIIGPIASAVSAAFEAQDREIPIVTLTQRENIPIIGDYVFRNFITPQMQVKTIVPYAAKTLGLRRFAILYPKEPYGTTFMNLFWDEVIASGGKVVGVEGYDPEQTDFAEPIKKMVGLFYELPEDLRPAPEPAGGTAAKPGSVKKADEPKAVVDFEAVFIPDAPKKAGLVIPQLLYYDVENVHLLGTNLWHSPRLIEMAGQYAQGAVLADGFFPESRSDPVVAFTRKFQEIYGETPGFVEAIAYDTAMMLFQTIARPDVDSRARIRDALLKIRAYPGVTGLTAFDETGEAVKQLYLLQVKGNRFVELKQ